MSNNPYAPPTAQVADVPQASAVPAFYVVGKTKFLVLYVATLGTYALYWFYKNWSNYKAATREDVWPVARAIFSIFFIHALFRSVLERIVAAGKSIKWDPQAQATLLVVLLVLSNIMDRVASRVAEYGFLDVASILLLIPLAITFLKAQAAINLASNDVDGASNSHLTGLNYLWIVIGAILWVFVFIGLFFGDALN